MNLKEYMTKNQITLEEGAQALGISYLYMSQLKSNRRPPSHFLAKKIMAWSNGNVTMQDLRPYIEPTYCPTCERRLTGSKCTVVEQQLEIKRLKQLVEDLTRKKNAIAV